MPVPPQVCLLKDRKQGGERERRLPAEALAQAGLSPEALELKKMAALA